MQQTATRFSILPLQMQMTYTAALQRAFYFMDWKCDLREKFLNRCKCFTLEKSSITPDLKTNTTSIKHH